MAKTTVDAWNIDFYKLTNLFQPIVPAFSDLSCNKRHWPDLDNYQTLLKKNTPRIANEQQIPIQFVKQSATCLSYQDQYEPRIYLKGEVQTRLNNWHDFFQVLVWKTFPKTKTLLNAQHYQASSKRLKNNAKHSQRTKIENFLTLFDECGIVIISHEERQLDLIKHFQWQTLFWENRPAFASSIACITFGHAMYEKALNPYIGMTANAILIHTNKDFFHLSEQEKLLETDELIVAQLKQAPSLNPFPILGVPGWHKANESLAFYLNENYFRKGRKKK